MLHEGPLTDYVPAAGLRWMLVASPSALFESPGLAEAIQRLVAPDRWALFARSTGVDLRKVPSAAIAGFDLGKLLLVESGPQTRSMEASFLSRLTEGPISKHPSPSLVRHVGVAGRSPLALLSVRDRFTAVAVDDTSLARVVEAFVRAKLHSSPSALAGAALATLPGDLHGYPLCLYVPGPFSVHDPLGGGLLSVSTAVAVALRPVTSDQLEGRVVLAGAWQAERSKDGERLLHAWRDVADSSTGRLLGLDRATQATEIRLSGSHIELALRLATEPLVTGLHRAVLGDAWEILDLEPPDAAGVAAPISK